MRLALLAASLALAPGEALAQTAPWPGYAPKMFRWDEDYGRLKDQARPDLPLKLKYLALDGHGDWLSLGGEYRFRIDDYSHPDFGLRGAEGFTSRQHRALIHGDAHFGPNLRAFVQLGAAAEDGRGRLGRPADRSDLDLAQGFVDLGWGPAAGRWRLRVGRQELGLGRYVSVREGTNIRRAFDGVRLDGLAGGWSLTGVAARAVRNAPDAFDDAGDRRDRLGFLGADHALGTSGYRLGLAYVEHDNEMARYAAGMGRERRSSLGVRIYGAHGPWDADGQVSWQFGRFTPTGRPGQDIEAWGAAFEGGRRLAVPWSPRLAVRIDGAGGDGNPNDGRLTTFDLPFPNLSYLTDAAVFAPRNVRDIQSFVTVNPTPALSLTAGAQFLWRNRRTDAVYAPNGAALLPPGGRGDYLATSPYLRASWRINPLVEWQLAAVRAEPGRALKAAGGRKPLSFFTTSIDVRF